MNKLGVCILLTIALDGYLTGYSFIHNSLIGVILGLLVMLILITACRCLDDKEIQDAFQQEIQEEDEEY